MEMILDFAKRLLLPRLEQGGVFADFTMGNGHDTLFLYEHLSQGEIYSFDIQPQAIQSTTALFHNAVPQNVHLILSSHEYFTDYFDGELEGGVFNLGYLPGGDKSLTTQTASTLEAVSLALSRLSPTGILVLVLYPGHPEGKEESRMTELFCRNLSGREYDVIKYDFINKKEPPYLIAIQKRKTEFHCQR